MVKRIVNSDENKKKNNFKPFWNRLPPKSQTLFGGIFMERKVKYDYAFKLACVKLVVEKYYS